MADYLLFQKAQRKSFTMSSVNDERSQGKLVLSESMLLVQETQSVFISTHNETLSIVTVCISNPHRSSF
jgi:hypothetical protein